MHRGPCVLRLVVLMDTGLDIASQDHRTGHVGFCQPWIMDQGRMTYSDPVGREPRRSILDCGYVREDSLNLFLLVHIEC